MFQMRGLGAVNIDRPGLNPGSGVPQPPSPWGGQGGGGGGAPPYFGNQMPVLTRSSGLVVDPSLRPQQPPSCPPGFAWGMQKNGQSGCFPTSDPVETQNPTPGTTVAVGAEPGTPAYNAMIPWYQRPIVIFGGLALALGLGIFIARKL